MRSAAIRPKRIHCSRRPSIQVSSTSVRLSCGPPGGGAAQPAVPLEACPLHISAAPGARSEEHTSELQSLMRSSYAVYCLKKKKHNTDKTSTKSRKKITSYNHNKQHNQSTL